MSLLFEYKERVYMSTGRWMLALVPEQPGYPYRFVFYNLNTQQIRCVHSVTPFNLAKSDGITGHVNRVITEGPAVYQTYSRLQNECNLNHQEGLVYEDAYWNTSLYTSPLVFYTTSSGSPHYNTMWSNQGYFDDPSIYNDDYYYYGPYLISGAINFYKTTPPDPIALKPGVSSPKLEFVLVDEGGNTYPYEDIEYKNSYTQAITITDNVITASDTAQVSSFLVTAKPKIYDINGDASETELFTFIPVEILPSDGDNDPYRPAGPSGPNWTPGSGNPGGGPSGPGTGTLVPNGSNNPNVADGGTFTMYAANMGTLQGLGAWLYSSNFFDAVGRDIMSALWNSPIDGIISITAFPFGVPAASSAQSNIKFGNLKVPISLPVLQNSSMQINWGSVTIEPTWNSFLDYAPHTKIELYLPFSTGFVTLDPCDVMDGSVSIVTNVDLIKGTCVHVVSGKYGVIGTYGGVCGLQIPVSGVDTAGKALNLLVSGVTTAVTAGAGAVGHDLKALGAISKTPDIGPMLPPMPGPPQLALPGSVPNTTAVANKVINAGTQFSAIASRTAHVAGKTAIAAFRTPASIQRSGSFATNGGGLGPTTPFIIFSCPDVNIPANYGHFYGYPLNATMKIGDLKGYSEITGVHLNNVPALLPELDEISSLLEGGVIL